MRTPGRALTLQPGRAILVYLLLLLAQRRPALPNELGHLRHAVLARLLRQLSLGRGAVLITEHEVGGWATAHVG